MTSDNVISRRVGAQAVMLFSGEYEGTVSAFQVNQVWLLAFRLVRQTALSLTPTRVECREAAHSRLLIQDGSTVANDVEMFHGLG